MELRDRPAMTANSGGATFFCEEMPASSGSAVLGEGAAHHVRVRRLEVGDSIRLVSGAGRTGAGVVAEVSRSRVVVSVEEVTEVAPLSPIHLCVPVADRDRMLWLAEKATELGVTSWQAVHFRRSSSVSPRGHGTAFAERVRARMISALEQSGGAWLPRIEADVVLEDLATPSPDSGTGAILLDQGGEALAALLGRLSERAAPVLLFGPEGGLEREERDMLMARGWQPARVAPATVRFETAGIAAVAVCRNVHMLGSVD